MTKVWGSALLELQRYETLSNSNRCALINHRAHLGALATMELASSQILALNAANVY